MLLSGSQNPHAVGPPSGQLPPLSIPCMVLPSPTLGPFPVLYSPTMPRPLSSAPGALPNAGPVNFGLPGLGSTAHLLIGPANVVNPKSSALPSADPQLQGPRPLSLSPEMSRSHNIIQPESPAYAGPPVSVVKLQQVSPDVSPGRSSFCDGVSLHFLSFASSPMTAGRGSRSGSIQLLLYTQKSSAYFIKHVAWRQEMLCFKDKNILSMFVCICSLKLEGLISGALLVNAEYSDDFSRLSFH